MKDLFGNTKPIQIEIGEWWFNGRIIQEQNQPRLSKYISFNDGFESYLVTTHSNFKEAKDYCFKNPCTNPENFPHNYIGGIKCLK